MAEPRRFTVSIIGAFLLFGIPVALFVWLGPFLPPNLMPFKRGVGWSSLQFHSFSVATGVGVGICAATLLLLIRSVLPPRLKSRIVWVPPQLLDRTLLRKQGLAIAAVVAVLFGIVLFNHYGPPRFWGDFTGMTEAAVRERLGEPFRDSRHNEDEEANEYRLGWQQVFSVCLFLEFKDGVVVSQERVSR